MTYYGTESSGEAEKMADAGATIGKTRTKLKPERRYKVDPEKKKASVATAARLHVVGNTYVYFSRPSRTSNQKKRTKRHAKYLQKQDENKTKARAR